MFENKTSTVIHKEITDDISNEYDKTTGGFIFDVTEPAAKQLNKAYAKMDDVAQLTDVENHHDEDLDKFIDQRTGQKRRLATHAIGFVDVVGNGLILIDDLFQTSSGIQFEATAERLIQGNGRIPVRSVLSGEIGNVPAGQITEMPVTLVGINSVTNSEPTSEGYEKESDVEFRQRYRDRIQTPATSGNKWHYRNWAKEVPGVGAVRIIPLWNGDNTVKIVIIDSNMMPASDLLVKAVQDHIDPGGTGLGDGQAPIGAFCTVVSAIGKTIDINFDKVMEVGYEEQIIIDNVSINATEYLKGIAFQQNFISYAQIGGLILESDGVIDYSNLTVNEGIENIILTDEEVAVLGGVTIDS